MPSVYDYRHVELDKIGRGKRVLNPPGGASSVVFGEDGSPEVHQNNTPNNLKSTALPANGHNGVESNGRRKSDCTQERLFGQAEEFSTPRKIVDRMKSRIFEDEVDTPSKTPTPGSSKRYVSRNPITGDVTEKCLNTPGQNGHTNGQDSSPVNGTPSSNPRVRNPPGGRSSGIF